MSKRSDFTRKPRDYYPTPIAAVKPLIPFLPKDGFSYCEPCAGDFRLCQHIDDLTGSKALLTEAYDIEPQDQGITKLDATLLEEKHVGTNCDLIITNPPWDRTKKSGYLLHTMIDRFANIRPTWLLFDADWIHTKQAVPYIEKYLVKIVSIGRVSWEENGVSGKDNCAWYLFQKDARAVCDHPEFYGRNILPA